MRAHAGARAGREAERTRLREECVAAAGAASGSLLAAANDEVARAFAQEKALEEEMRRLQSEADRFCRRTEQWVALVDDFNRALKEIGDVENWSRAIERDMNEVVARLEVVHGRTSSLEAPQ